MDTDTDTDTDTKSQIRVSKSNHARNVSKFSVEYFILFYSAVW